MLESVKLPVVSVLVLAGGWELISSTLTLFKGWFVAASTTFPVIVPVVGGGVELEEICNALNARAVEYGSLSHEPLGSS